MTPYERHKARMQRLTAAEREAWNARQRAYYRKRKATGRRCHELLRLRDFMPPDDPAVREVLRCSSR